MSDSDEIKKIFTDRIAKEDEYLARIAKLTALVPSIQHQKEADIASLELINSFPADYAEETASKWLTIEKENNKILSVAMPTLPEIIKNANEVLYTTSSGTILPYVSSGSTLVQPFIASGKEIPDWVKNVTVVMDQYNIKAAQNEYIPKRLDILNADLGEMFKVALISYNKCKNNIIGVDQAAIQLRDVLEGAWGGVANKARTENTDKSKNTNHLELRKPGDRDLVAEILANAVIPKVKLVTLLSDMYDLHYKLSAKDFGKNPLGKDFPMLKAYYNQWITLLDGISGLVV